MSAFIVLLPIQVCYFLASLAITSLWFSCPNETNVGKIDTVLSSELCKAVSLWLAHKISLDIL